MMMYDFYKILGVERSASLAQIRAAYRRKAKLYHPDINSSASAHDFFTILNEANDTLSDERKRRRYDIKLEYQEFHASEQNTVAQPPHRDPAYRRNPAKENPASREENEEKLFQPSGPLFKFFLFAIMFIGMLCIFIPSLAVYHDVINYGVLLLLFPGFFMVRDVARTILVSE